MKRILLFVILATFIVTSAYGKDIGIGVLMSSSEISDNVKAELQKELKSNFAGTEFNPKIVKIVDVNRSNFQSELSKMENNTKIDGIFVLNFEMPSAKIFNRNNKFYSFPFGFIPVDTSKLPKNINYIYSNIDFKEEASLLKEIGNINKIAVAIPNLNSEVGMEQRKLTEKMFSKEGLQVEVISSEQSQESIDEVLNRVQAVYVISYGVPPMDIIGMANSKKLPTFTVDFSSKMNDRALMGYDLNDEVKKRLRAASLNYMTYKTGKERGMISNVGDLRKNIFFNMGVAHSIGYYPNLLFLQKVSTINNYEIKKKKLNMVDAINRALQVNPSVLSKDQDIQSGYYNVQVANSARLPQLSVNAQYNALDKDATSAMFNKPENSVNSYLQLSQVIFSDQINANVYINKLQLENARATSQQEKLDTIYYVASTYLNILQLKAQLEIQKGNYAVVKQSLNVANINYKVGSGGAQDVYRLEASLSDALSNIAAVEGQIKIQEAYLNKLLNYPVNQTYEYDDIGEMFSKFAMGKNFLEKYAYGSAGTTKFLQYLIDGSLKNSQGLRQYENNIKMKEREYTAAGRERYIPTVQAVGQYNKNNIVSPWGKNSDLSGDPEYWQAGITVSLPLIKGGEVVATQNMVKSEIKSLEYQKSDFENQVAQLVSQTFTKLLTDYVQTYTTKIASDAAVKNLKIVSNLYAEGSVTITDLLDAQNSTLSSQLNNVIANYNLLNSAIKLENLYGDYTITKTPAEREEIVKNLKNIMSK